jgi:hypothetical protein
MCDPWKVDYTCLSNAFWFDALKSGLIDMRVRTTIWHAQRDIVLGRNFGSANYYDGKVFMIRSGLNSMEDFMATPSASSVASEGTTTIEALDKMFEGTDVTVVTAFHPIAVAYMLQTRSVDCYTTDSSRLAATLSSISDTERGYLTILPNLYSKDPLAFVTR